MRIRLCPGIAPFARLLWCVLIFTCVSLAQAQAPRLELLSALEGGTIRLLLHGETNRTYLVEASTNLTSWRAVTRLQTTNGTGTLSYDASQSRHSFLRARIEQVRPSVTPQIAADYSASAFISADGGEVELVTADLRSITLSIPAGCLVNSTEVRLSLVTNLVGLPFAGGSIGTVRIEPEGLFLLGTAALTIEVPQGLDSRSVVSFTANNNGIGFGLTVDRAETNHMVIPVSDFALYGSAIATLAEIEALAGPNGGTNASAGLRAFGGESIEQELCRIFHPDEFRVNTDQFPKSSSECFAPFVERAIAVQHELKTFLICEIMADLAVVLAFDRQRQMVGLPSNAPTIISNTVSRVCPIYQEKIEPLWAEAEHNCPLSIVLMQFMLGFERQIQMLGMTNLANCDYTLFSNAERVCNAAKECIRETEACCALGKRGQEKYLEISSIVRQFDLLGDSCFPKGMEEPIVLQALDVCLTNAWYGSFQVRHYGNFTKVTQAGNTHISQVEEIDLKFDGGVFTSDEQPALPGFGKGLNLRILGNGSAKVDNSMTSIQRTPCRDGNTAESRSYYRDLTTGSFNGTNGVQVIWGAYEIGIHIRPDNTYSISGGGPLLRTKVNTVSYSWSSNCDGKVSSLEPDVREDQSGALFPLLTPPLIRPMSSDTNSIRGTHRVIDNSGDHPVTTEFNWIFWRALNR